MNPMLPFDWNFAQQSRGSSRSTVTTCHVKCGREPDGDEPVGPSQTEVKARPCQGADDNARETGESRLDVVTQQHGSTHDASLLVILPVGAGIDGVIYERPAVRGGE
jgi:hypothetical protein